MYLGTMMKCLLVLLLVPNVLASAALEKALSVDACPIALLFHHKEKAERSFYGPPTNFGGMACGISQIPQAGANIKKVAIGGAHFYSHGAACGTCVEIENQKFFAVDKCGGCDADLFISGNGREFVPMNAVPCDGVGSSKISYELSDGGTNRWYIKLRVLNYRIPLWKVEVNAGGWKMMKRGEDDSWLEGDSLAKPLPQPLQVRLTAIDGQVVTDNIAPKAASTGTAQFNDPSPGFYKGQGGIWASGSCTATGHDWVPGSGSTSGSGTTTGSTTGSNTGTTGSTTGSSGTTTGNGGTSGSTTGTTTGSSGGNSGGTGDCTTCTPDSGTTTACYPTSMAFNQNPGFTQSWCKANAENCAPGNAYTGTWCSRVTCCGSGTIRGGGNSGSSSSGSGGSSSGGSSGGAMPQCSGYQVKAAGSSIWPEFDGTWTYAASVQGKPLYAASVGGTNYYLHWSSKYSAWIVNQFVTLDNNPVAMLEYDGKDPCDCGDAKWRFKKGGVWQTDAAIKMCCSV